MLIVAGIGVCLSCADYTPKPRGYFRIEPPPPLYIMLPLDKRPYSFNISAWAAVEMLPSEEKEGEWFNLSYPGLGATVYCSFLKVKPSALQETVREARSLVLRQARQTQAVTEQVYANLQERVYASLYELDGEVASPLQFVLTDSATYFFKGALLYDCRPNADSLAPVTQYLKVDLRELIQSFRWNN
jgi:gliding motility-associated lipoprotein GldD